MGEVGTCGSGRRPVGSALACGEHGGRSNEAPTAAPPPDVSLGRDVEHHGHVGHLSLNCRLTELDSSPDAGAGRRRRGQRQRRPCRHHAVAGGAHHAAPQDWLGQHAACIAGAMSSQQQEEEPAGEALHDTELPLLGHHRLRMLDDTLHVQVPGRRLFRAPRRAVWAGGTAGRRRRWRQLPQSDEYEY